MVIKKTFCPDAGAEGREDIIRARDDPDTDHRSTISVIFLWSPVYGGMDELDDRLGLKRAYQSSRQNTSRVLTRIKDKVTPEVWALVVELEGHLQDQVLIALNMGLRVGRSKWQGPIPPAGHIICASSRRMRTAAVRRSGGIRVSRRLRTLATRLAGLKTFPQPTQARRRRKTDLTPP